MLYHASADGCCCFWLAVAARPAHLHLLGGKACQMVETEHDLANAPIKYEAYVRGPEETGIAVLRMDTESGPTFFEMHLRFAANGNDFWVVISNFGLPDRAFAGSRTSSVQRKFSPTEVESVRERLREYFSGPEEKKYAPFSISGSRFLGVEFADGWIVQKGQK